jgi:hypothetical protein
MIYAGELQEPDPFSDAIKRVKRRQMPPEAAVEPNG